MKIDRLRVVLDTNIVLSSISRSSPYRKIMDAFDDGKFDLYLDQEILLEYDETLTSYFNVETSKNFIKSLAAATNVYPVKRWFRMNLISADPDDNKFVDCAFACNAHFIISNDKHLNVLKNISFPKITVLKIDEFMALLETL